MLHKITQARKRKFPMIHLNVEDKVGLKEV